MQREYPRVLHVGFEPIGAPNNTGLTVASMFSEWPQDKLLQVYDRPAQGERVLPGGHHLNQWAYPIDHAARSLLGRRTPSGAIDGMNNSVRRTRRLTPVERVKVLATVVNDLTPVRVPAGLDEVVGEFRPQVLHTLLGGARQMSLAIKIADRYDLPLVPHYMDDWPEHLHGGAPLAPMARARVSRLHDGIIRRSAVGLAIGTAMAAEFEQRYSIPFSNVGNGVPSDLFIQPRVEATPRTDGKRVLRYAGGLHLGRDAVVDELARRLALDPAGAQWQIELFAAAGASGPAVELSARHENVTYVGAVAHDDVLSTLATADALLFMESEDPGVLPFTRWSVSTKVPEYLAAARPVLCVGPADQASIAALLRYGRAVRVSLAEADWGALADFLGGEPGRVAWTDAMAAQMVAEFGAEAVAERLRKSLVAAAGRG